MPDSKITALTSISTSTDPANDPLVIVDVSDTSMAATGTTKKVTLNQLLGAGGTATLASATITGGLTVQGVGGISIGSASFTSGRALAATSPAGSAVGIRLLQSATSDWEITNVATAGNLSITQSGANLLSLTGAGVFTFGDGAGGTRMTLNSTGLGVGGSPTRKLSIVGSGATYANINSGDNTSLVGLLLGGTSTPSAGQVIYDNTANSLAFFTSGSSRLLIDSSGNVGIGVTPSGTIYSSSETRFVVKGTATSYAGTVAVQSKGTTNAVTGFLTAGDGVNEVAIGSATNTPINFYTNNLIKATIDTSGNLILQSSATPATLTTNGQLTVNATSNTNLRFSYRGSDGVTRVANITLA